MSLYKTKSILFSSHKTMQNHMEITCKNKFWIRNMRKLLENRKENQWFWRGNSQVPNKKVFILMLQFLCHGKTFLTVARFHFAVLGYQMNSLLCRLDTLYFTLDRGGSGQRRRIGLPGSSREKLVSSSLSPVSRFTCPHPSR